MKISKHSYINHLICITDIDRIHRENGDELVCNDGCVTEIIHNGGQLNDY